MPDAGHEGPTWTSSPRAVSSYHHPMSPSDIVAGLRPPIRLVATNSGGPTRSVSIVSASRLNRSEGTLYYHIDVFYYLISIFFVQIILYIIIKFGNFEIQTTIFFY